MTDWKLPWTGRCRCERVTFHITAPPLLTMACHCRGCQRMSASAYSLSVAVPAPGFSITKGETVIGGIHGPDAHHHCDYCKSWLFTKPSMLPQLVNVRATMLDDASWYRPFMETSTAEGLPWAKTGAPYSFPNIPTDQETYTPILAAFAASGIRP